MRTEAGVSTAGARPVAGSAPLGWRRLMTAATSRRTAIVLMALFLGCLALQALLPQRGVVSPLQYASWRERYGALAAAAETLGLDDISAAPWFWALGAGIALSLALSAARRAQRLLASPDRPPRGVHSVQTDIDGGHAAGEVAAALKRHGYTVAVTEEGVAGRKGTAGAWGSVLFHGGLLVVYAGILLSAATRFTGYIELAPGTVFQEADGYAAERHVPLGRWTSRDLSIGVQDMGAQFWPDDTLRDIWALVSVADGGGESVTGVSRRNQPVKLGSAAVTVGGPFGAAALLEFRGPDGSAASQGYVHFPSDGAEPGNRFSLPTGVWVDARLEGAWRDVLSGEVVRTPPALQLAVEEVEGGWSFYDLPLGEAVRTSGGELRFVALEPWALFMVQRDRGLAVITAGAVAAIAGLALALFIAPRWVLAAPTGAGWLMTARTTWGKAALVREARALSRELAARTAS